MKRRVIPAEAEAPADQAAPSFTFAGTHTDDDLTEPEREVVAHWLNAHPESYTIRGSGRDVRLTLKWQEGKSGFGDNDAGQFSLAKDGTLWLLGDDGFGWASTMSKRTVRSTLARMLTAGKPASRKKHPAEFRLEKSSLQNDAYAPIEQSPIPTHSQKTHGKAVQPDLFDCQDALFGHVRQPWELLAIPAEAEGRRPK